jgi:hypothetical protein
MLLHRAENFEIHFNALHIYEPALDSNRIVVEATRFIPHQQFSVDYSGAINDIAIIYLDAPVTGVTPAKVPNKSDDWPLDNYLSVKAVGYGITDRKYNFFTFSRVGENLLAATTKHI